MGVDSAAQTDPEEQPKSRVREFADILNPLFWMDDFNRPERLLEFACTLVRAAGLEDTGWDSYQESLVFMEDLKRLWSLDLSPNVFPEEIRHMKYCINPFAHLYPAPKKNSTYWPNESLSV